MQALLEALAALVAVLITGFLIPCLKAHADAEKQATVLQWVDAAVAAAEQLYEAGQGEEKKAYVVSWLADCGIDISGIDLDAIIEAAVYEVNQNG